VSKERLLCEAKLYAVDLITRNSPESLRQSKRQVYIDFHRDVGTANQEAGELLKAMIKQPNYREGVSALIEKRKPNWNKG